MVNLRALEEVAPQVILFELGHLEQRVDYLTSDSFLRLVEKPENERAGNVVNVRGARIPSVEEHDSSPEEVGQVLGEELQEEVLPLEAFGVVELPQRANFRRQDLVEVPGALDHDHGENMALVGEGS